MQILQILIRLGKLASVSIPKTMCQRLHCCSVNLQKIYYCADTMRCLLKLWQDVACALSQNKTPQAPRCTVGYEAVAEPISVWALAEKKKQHFLLFCGTEALQDYLLFSSHHWIWQKDMGHSVRHCHLQMNRVLYIAAVFACCSKCRYKVIWCWN